MNTQPGRPAKTAIATLCLGGDYAAYWHKYCAPSWVAYAQRHGYALEMFETSLDGSERAAARSPAWQKCLILSQPRMQNYERVVWLDADIVIAPHAPALPDAVPTDKIGAVISGDYLQSDMKAVFLERIRGTTVSPDEGTDEAWQADQRSFYEATGVHCITSDIVQTGVLILNQTHRSLLERIYNAPYPADLMCYEQFPLSAAILNEGLLYRLDSRFNLVFYERMLVHYPYLLNTELPDYHRLAQLAVMAEYSNCFFLHFAHDRGFAQHLDPNVYAKSRQLSDADRNGGSGTAPDPARTHLVKRLRDLTNRAAYAEGVQLIDGVELAAESDPNLLYYAGVCLGSTDRREVAIAALKRALERGYAPFWCAYHLGLFEMRRGNNVNAAFYYVASLLAKPARTDIHLLLSQIAAGFDFELLRAAQGGARSAAAAREAYALGTNAQEAGRAGIAAAAFTIALFLDPDHPEMRARLRKLAPDVSFSALPAAGPQA